jgi:hypothetical protein
MIQFPRRSVTRFFIPLVDVMILLFSMFMLMPIVQKAAEGGQEGTERSAEDLHEDKKALERELKRRTDELKRLQKLVKPQEDLAKLKEELERLRKEKIKVLQERLAIRVLEIDPKTGDLVYYEGGPTPKRRLIASKEAAAALIQKQRQEVAPRELYYLFLFPRVDSAFPEERQFEQYKEWFRQTPYGIDRPGLDGK